MKISNNNRRRRRRLEEVYFRKRGSSLSWLLGWEVPGSVSRRLEKNEGEESEKITGAVSGTEETTDLVF